MGKITEIKTQKNKNRVSVFIDGEFVCGIQTLTAVKYGVKEGAEFSVSRLTQIAEESDKQVASDKAMDYIQRRARSKKQMQKYLLGKDYSPALVDMIIKKLEYYGYIDDRKLALSYVGLKKDSRGVNRIRADLMRMEIDKEIIDDALSSASSQYEACLKYAQKFMKSKKNPTKPKLYAHLVGKGFAYDDIARAVSTFDFKGGNSDETTDGEEVW
jgi:regulatory protein